MLCNKFAYYNCLHPCYRYYEGCTPVLVTNDLDMIQDVFLKKHSAFRDRKVMIYVYRQMSERFIQ